MDSKLHPYQPQMKRINVWTTDLTGNILYNLQQKPERTYW